MSTIATAPAAVNPVTAAERAILHEEGSYHVAGVYYSCVSVADQARRIEAERRVAAAERTARWLAAHPCRWCGEQIQPGEGFTLIADEPLHTERCTAQLDQMLYPQAA